HHIYQGENITLSDSVMYRNTISNTEIEYTIRRIVHAYHQSNNGYVIRADIDTFIMNVSAGELIKLDKLPEEWGMDRLIRYNPADTGFCRMHRSYVHKINDVYYYGNYATVNTHEPCGGPNYVHRTGMGETSYSYCYDPSGKN